MRKQGSLIGDLLAEMRSDIDYLPEDLDATMGQDSALIKQLFEMAVKHNVMVKTMRGYRVSARPKRHKRRTQVDWVGRRRRR